MYFFLNANVIPQENRPKKKRERTQEIERKDTNKNKKKQQINNSGKENQGI